MRTMCSVGPTRSHLLYLEQEPDCRVFLSQRRESYFSLCAEFGTPKAGSSYSTFSGAVITCPLTPQQALFRLHVWKRWTVLPRPPLRSVATDSPGARGKGNATRAAESELGASWPYSGRDMLAEVKRKNLKDNILPGSYFIGVQRYRKSGHSGTHL